jgi:hypothetical protein
MSDTNTGKTMTAEEAAKAVYEYGAQLLAAKVSDAEIIRQMMEKGLTEEMANKVLSNLKQAKGGLTRKEGAKNMGFGALWAIGGTVVSLVTMEMAHDGGTYYVFWGAVIYGVFLFIRGLVQFLSGK